MKWLSFLIFAVLGIGVTHTSALCADIEKVVEIQSITYSYKAGEERISFKLSASLEPTLFFIKGDKPRLVVDFYNGLFKGQRVVPVKNGELVTAIRTGVHVSPKKKLRVVVDLVKGIPVHFIQEYSEETKQLNITIKPVTIKDQSLRGDEQPLKIEEKKLPSREELDARALDKKPVPPVFIKENDIEKTVAADSTEVKTGVEVAQILGISFDDTSNRGEMVLFRLNDFHPPIVSALEKEKPRIICEFLDMSIAGDIQGTILTNGTYVHRIKTTKEHNPEKVRVVLELSPDRDYDLQQVFFKNDNLFVLIINELSPENQVLQDGVSQ